MTRRYPPRSATIHNPETEILRPVIGLDIDGTLAEYHDHFLRFAEGWLGRKMAFGYDGSMPLHKWMHISKSRYRECKMAYRKGGLKRSMPVKEGAAALARGLRKRGAIVVLCTTRPFLMLDNIDPDTREWAKRNRIQYDHLLHGERKYRDLHVRYGSQVVMVLEDLPELIEQAKVYDCHPVMMRGLHNTGNLHMPFVSTLGDALSLGLSRMGSYEKRPSVHK